MEDSQSEQQRIIRRHHREKKELQARIQGMKNSVPKSDKKRRKQLLLDVARLEAEMEQKHQQELEKFQESFPDNGNLDSVTEDLAKMDLENQPPRQSRAQRRRERRAALERERQERITEAEMEHLASFRRDEEEKLAAILGSKNLELKDIPADGHCMYRAIQDQLVFSVTVESLRKRTADYMRKHVDDFLPFFSDPDTGNAYSREDFLSYCDDIVRSPSWGGQLELRALSHVLQTPIEVIQADSPAVVIGGEYTRKPLTLVYLRYACNLGEHYNSVRPLEAGAVGGAAPRLF
ncbi:OTU domain-containing protein 6A [Lutra lutra]|uniref:ubiquitinyl hydrolase 1 n=1 Tax=Enhydra lutris kenyoni TaxID=391180 RepID=A0A2Y9L4B4_ENHLU|nr:OTU domain-containing protein 6A [Enhydra lutris kenyoni]XP_047572197.1 OTU domain-containing protein 6A [Lutra lutra]